MAWACLRGWVVRSVPPVPAEGVPCSRSTNFVGGWPKRHRHRHAETLLREMEGADIPPEVLDQVQRFLTTDGDRIFRLWFGERDYKKHSNLATFECAQGGIRSLPDYVRRDD